MTPTIKLIILLIISIIMGIIFITVGVYFRSKSFLAKINDSTPEKNEENLKKNQIRANGASYVATGIGALTILWGIMLYNFPQIAGPLALIYMLALIISFVFLTFIFK